MNRFDVMTGLLARRKFFKLVCGAGNEDAEEVKKLAFIYTLAGAKGMDVSARTQSPIEYAFQRHHAPLCEMPCNRQKLPSPVYSTAQTCGHRI